MNESDEGATTLQSHRASPAFAANARSARTPEFVHLTVTARVAEPPRLLLTVTLCGFEDVVNWPEYLPPLTVLNCPMNAPVEVA